MVHTHTRHLKYSQLHTNWVPDIKSFEHLLDWSVIITNSGKSVWLFMCITSAAARGVDMPGLEWRIQRDVCHVCSPSPSGAHCFTYSPSGTDWLLFKQRWWARNMAQSAPQRCSLWWMSRGVKYRLPFLLRCRNWMCAFPRRAPCGLFVGASACRFVRDLCVLNSYTYSMVSRWRIYTVHGSRLSTVSLLTPLHPESIH